jgi:ring-1,2-phenylacetyl-CoA epoxidase subunit PaaD
VVTRKQVWEALAEIPDPEIPVISLVDLGVIRGVAVENGTVRVDFTPTFLGCPALDVMRDAMAERIRTLGAEPEIVVHTDDSWSTDRISAEGRDKLRAAGFAPPLPRLAWQRTNGRVDEPRGLSSGGASAASARSAHAPTLVQLQSNVFRCPYCGSTDTRLDNIFGPTPCRSLRYCTSCRQPFEQFKTI